MRILLIEDEIKIAQFAHDALKAEGHAVDHAQNGAQARELFVQTQYDLVVLDVLLPDDDGIQLCRLFKQLNAPVPILLLTTLSQLNDKLRGFESGADDYLTKPYHVDEFIARVRVLLRRSAPQSTTLTCGDLVLDLQKRQATRAGQVIKLTNKEFALLEYFMHNQGRPLSRTQIAQHVWDLNFDPESNVVDAYVKHLRKKVDASFPSKMIKTIIGYGYALSPE